MISNLFLLISGHFLCDYPLQGDFIGRFKNRNIKHETTFHGGHGIPWWHLMAAHSFIHAGAVLLITHSIIFASIELIAHFIIDCLKCEGYTDINIDQAMHIVCKIGYAYFI